MQRQASARLTTDLLPGLFVQPAAAPGPIAI